MGIVVREYQWISISGDSSGAISYDQACYLDSLKEIYGVEIFQWGKGAIRPRNYVGFIRLGSTSLEILPKLDLDEDLSRKNLLFMLVELGDLGRRIPWKDTKGHFPRSFLDFLAWSITREIKASLKYGIPRDYVRNTAYVSALKGKIIFKPCANPNKLLCSFDLFTTDNPVTRLIVKVLKILLDADIEGDIRREVEVLLGYYKGIDDRYVDPRAVRLSQRNIHLKEVLRLCKYILSGFSPCGEGENYFSLIVDMNILFERFIAMLIRGIFKGVREKNPRLPFLMDKGTGEKIYKMAPDIVVGWDGRRSDIIIDAKWKVLEGLPPREDLYQLFSYSHVYKPEISALIYPSPSRRMDRRDYEFPAGGLVRVLEVGMGLDLSKEKGSILSFLRDNLRF